MKERYSRAAEEYINSEELRVFLIVFISIWISIYLSNNDFSQAELTKAILSGPVPH